MREIVVISGKGGTGKTTVCASFAHLAASKVICDLDVDAPDLHILLQPQIREHTPFISGHGAQIRQDDCIRCGQCAELCRFEAVRPREDGFIIDDHCEGCGVCVKLCPQQAIDFPEKHCGDWYVSDTRFGLMVHAQLFPGQENSGRLVSLLKVQARERARALGLDTILCDGSPGVGCPVISSLSGASLAWASWSPHLRVATISAAWQTCAGTSASRWPSSSTRLTSIPVRPMSSPPSASNTAIPCWGGCPSIRW